MGLVAALVVVLGVLQFLGSVAVRSSAQGAAWVGLVPASVAARVDALDTAWPLPQALRLVLARHDLERGELGLAEANIAYLHPSRDRFALEGRLAEARHDDGAAVSAFLQGGDLSDLLGVADGRARRGDLPGAIMLERAAIVRLQGDRTQADALAEAYLHLGMLEQARAYEYAAGTQERQDRERRALVAYTHAAALAPLSIRYVIALGNQQLNLGRISAAVRSFARAREIDPTSAEPLAGLADAALRSHDVAAARAYYARARALDPSSPAVHRLAPRVGS
jgi:tetratricopeptide (TPR) repeat protein